MIIHELEMAKGGKKKKKNSLPVAHAELRCVCYYPTTAPNGPQLDVFISSKIVRLSIIDGQSMLTIFVTLYGRFI